MDNSLIYSVCHYQVFSDTLSSDWYLNEEPLYIYNGSGDTEVRSYRILKDFYKCNGYPAINIHNMT